MAKVREPSPLWQPAGTRAIPRSTLAVLAVWTVAYVLAVIVRAENPLARFAQDVAAPALVLTACALAGYTVLDWLKADWLGPVERLLAGAGLGLGVLGLATFFLGLAGFMNLRLAPLLLLLVGLARVPRVAEQLGEWRREAASALGPLGWTLVGLAGLEALLLVWSAWGSLPDDDAMTHVLALPKTWLHGGGIRETPNNVYGYYPLGAEMLTQAAMSLRWVAGRAHDSIAQGVLLAGTFNAYLAILAACATAALAARLFGPKAAAPAAALGLALPSVYQASYTPGIENTRVLFAALALVALAACAESRRTGAAVLAGVMTGLSFGASYTAFVLLFVPGLLFLAGAGVRRGARATGLWATLAYVSAAALAALPWLVRNYAWTGNPVHPLLADLFGPGPYWSAQHAARFAACHGPPPDLLFSLGRALAPASALGAIPVVLVLGLSGAGLAALKGRRTAGTLLGAYGAAVFLGWFFTTSHDSRDLAPLWTPLVALAACGLAATEGHRRRGVLAAACVATVFVGMVYALNSQRANAREGVVTDLAPGATAGKGQPTYSGYVMDFLNRGFDLPRQWRETLPPGVPVAVGLVGEDRTLALVRPVAYNSRWDEPWLAGALAAWSRTASPDAVRGELRRLGIASIYVNWAEIDRLRSSGCPGWPEEIHPALFDAWVRTGLLKPEAVYGPADEAARPGRHVIYRVVY